MTVDAEFEWYDLPWKQFLSFCVRRKFCATPCNRIL